MHKINPLVYLFTLGHFATDWSQGAIPALLPYFIATCGLNYQDAATLIFANILLASISQPIFGYYSDKVSKPWFVPAGPILCGVTVALIADYEDGIATVTAEANDVTQSVDIQIGEPGSVVG